MGNSDSWKPGTAPGGNPPPAKPAAAAPKPAPPTADPSSGNAAGRVIHDERGNAVWDWVKDTARIAIDSTSRLLMRLEVPELTMEDTQEQEFRVESDRDAGGGYDPYGGAGPTSGRNATPGRTSSARDVAKPSATRASNSGVASRSSTFENISKKSSSGDGATNNAGGGYDPYGKGVTSKPTRKP